MVEWRFAYDSLGNFISTTEAETHTIVVPTATPISLADNLDNSINTVMYPYWATLSTPFKPLVNSVGLAALSSATAVSTNSDHYFTTLETVTTTFKSLLPPMMAIAGKLLIILVLVMGSMICR
ncbi:hypothetical protein CNR22_24360 [Sphingobacteriaceae bacterium]|nr:hypothetical protein CNR22_24360 [Sphingobacteriaceae bacterium]